MTYRFDLDPAQRILRLSYIGRITDDLIKKAYKATPKAVQQTNPRGMIIDLSDVTEFNVSTQTIHELADLKPTVKDPSVPRIIVAPTPYLFGMSRMFQILGGQTRPMLQVMSSLDEACVELALENPKFEPVLED